jgi:hypothetical protein
VERVLGEAGRLTRLAALAAFDDAERGAEVLPRLHREAGAALAEAFRECDDERHELAPAGAVDLVRRASKLVAWIRGLP